MLDRKNRFQCIEKIAAGITPVSYFDSMPKNDPELPGLFSNLRKSEEAARQRFRHPVSQSVRTFQNRQNGPAPDLSRTLRGPTSEIRHGDGSAPVSRVPNSAVSQYRNWDGWQNKKSTQMMANMNKRITPNDAYAEIMKRRPGMDQAKARRLAALVAKNYRVNANGKWVGKSRGTNERIVAQLNGRPQISGTNTAVARNTPAPRYPNAPAVSPGA